MADSPDLFDSPDTPAAAATPPGLTAESIGDRPIASPVALKYLRLHLCPEVGSIRFGNLIRELGGIDAVLRAAAGRLQSVTQVGPKTADRIARHRDEVDVDMEVRLAGELGCRILCLADPEYPAILKMIDDPPPCLYYRGTLDRGDGLALAIVGSRRCSRYGAEQAERFAALAVRAGMTVISGLARGIDSFAHRGALKAGGRTLAVTGCGLAHVFPQEQEGLAGEIAANGAVISELPMTIPPDAKNFPPRNRIIAGLSLGVMVIEAAQRSGALITARLAGEYNREVFAVPGPIDSPYAEGANDLIRQGAAKLVMRMEDVLAELGEAGALLMQAGQSDSSDPSGRSESPAQGGERINPPREHAVALTELQSRIVEAVAAGQRALDDLCEVVGETPGRIASQLITLQLLGVVRRLPGEMYEATRK
ncbi:MAG: DNA processing protein DprA [Phycisphaerae bacterium]|nr:MAG: DNA-protecting protein DprA [Planctomycetia bacterium]GJQ26469.1 MAG: DNA processing protein DprA [Phycisphaerae bacterium]